MNKTDNWMAYHHVHHHRCKKNKSSSRYTENIYDHNNHHRIMDSNSERIILMNSAGRNSTQTSVDPSGIKTYNDVKTDSTAMSFFDFIIVSLIVVTVICTLFQLLKKEK